jgi:hypothetical protein
LILKNSILKDSNSNLTSNLKFLMLSFKNINFLIEKHIFEKHQKTALNQKHQKTAF